MLEKELNELSHETILTLYKSIVPSTSIIEAVNRKLERQSAEGTLRNKKELSKRNDNDFRADKTFLNFQRHLIELKLLSVKILEEINKRARIWKKEHYENKDSEWLKGMSLNN